MQPEFDLSQWLSPEEQKEFEKKKGIWLSQVPGFGQEIQKLMSQYSQRDMILTSLAKNPYVPVDVLFRIFSIAEQESANQFSPPLHEAVYALMTNPAIVHGEEDDPHVAALKEVIESYEFPEGFLEKKKTVSKKPATPVKSAVEWKEGNDFLSIVKMAKFINSVKAVLSSSTNAIVKVSLPKPYQSSTQKKKFKKWEIDLSLNGVEVAKIEIAQSYDDMKLSINGNEQLFPITTESIAQLADLIKQMEEGKAVNVGDGQSTIMPEETQTFVQPSKFIELADSWIDDLIINVNKELGLTKTIPYNLSSSYEPTQGEELLLYVIDTPNTVSIFFSKSDKDNIVHCEAHSTLLDVNEYKFEIAFADEFNSIKIDLINFIIRNNGTYIEKELNKIKIPGMFLAPVNPNKIGTWYFIYNPEASSEAVQKMTNNFGQIYGKHIATVVLSKGGIHFSVVETGEEKSFFTLGDISISFMLQMLGKVSYLSQFLTKDDPETIVKNISQELQKYVANTYIKVNPGKFRIMVKNGTVELSKITFGDEEIQIKNYEVPEISKPVSNTTNVTFISYDYSSTSKIVEFIKNNLILITEKEKEEIPEKSSLITNSYTFSLEITAKSIEKLQQAINVEIQIGKFPFPAASFNLKPKEYWIDKKGSGNELNSTFAKLIYYPQTVEVSVAGSDLTLKQSHVTYTSSLFDKWFEKDLEAGVVHVATFIADYILSFVKNEYKKKPQADFKSTKTKQPQEESTVVTEGFSPTQPSFDPKSWNVSSSDPWYLCLELMNLVYETLLNLSPSTKKYSTNIDTDVSAGKLGLDVTTGGVLLAKVVAFRKLNKVLVNSEKWQKSYQISSPSSIYGILQAILNDIDSLIS